jgi:hypothetical protein
MDFLSSHKDVDETEDFYPHLLLERVVYCTCFILFCMDYNPLSSSSPPLSPTIILPLALIRATPRVLYKNLSNIMFSKLLNRY